MAQPWAVQIQIQRLFVEVTMDTVIVDRKKVQSLEFISRLKNCQRVVRGKYEYCYTPEKKAACVRLQFAHRLS